MGIPNGEIYVAKCALGRGVFAGRYFHKGEFLFRFSGPVITLAEAIKKGEAEGNVLQVAAWAYIDLEPPGVFANHSCQPNAGVRDGVCGYALRHIRPGEEILYDYSTTISERRWTMQCKCGTPACRGVIGDFHDLPLELQRRYLAIGIVQPFIVGEVQSSQDAGRATAGSVTAGVISNRYHPRREEAALGQGTHPA